MRQLRENRFLFVFGADRTAVGTDQIEMRIVDVFDARHRRQIGQAGEHQGRQQAREQQGVAGILAARLLECGHRCGHRLHTGQCHRARGEGAQDDEDRRQSEGGLVVDPRVGNGVIGRLRLREVAGADPQQAHAHGEEYSAEEQVGRDGKQHRGGA